MPGYQPRLVTDHVWFNGTDIHTFAYATQTGIRVTAINGWDDRPDIRDVRENRSGQDGEYADNLYIGGRTITIQGEVYGSSWVNLQARKRELAALFAPSSTEALFKVPDPATASPTGSYTTTGMAGYERVSARVIEPIMFGDLIGSVGQAFQVVLRASDPRVYSDVETSTDSGTTGTASRTVTVDQTGTYETPPVVTATGPTASTWTVSEPSSGLSLSMSGLTLASGETVAANVKDRTLTITSTYAGIRTKRSDCLAVWMLNETSGTAADNAQGNATYDGTYTGGFTLNQTGPKSGVAAVDLNGSTGYVTIPYAAALNPAVCSFEVWVNFDAVSGANRTIAESFDGTNGWALQYDNSVSSVVLSRNTPSGLTFYSILSPVVSTWYHLAFVLGPTSSKAYVNGVLAGSDSLATTPATSGAFQLGRNGSSWYLDGKLAGAALYSSALSAADVAELYAATTATATSSGYSYLNASSSRWGNLGVASSTFTMASSGLASGSKLNVAYRDARL